MTRADAAELITTALCGPDKQPPDIELCLSADQLAIALDALGLLTYATDPHLHPASATSQTQERSSHAVIGPDQPGQNHTSAYEPGNQDHPVAQWASKRQRP